MTVEAPRLSVVVPSVNGLPDLLGCLDALAAEADRTALEVLVVDRIGPEVRTVVHSRFPAVRILPVSPDTTIPAMRAVAFDEARADVVAVIEDHVLVPPGWADAHLRQHADGAPVAGGAVTNAAVQRFVDRVAFLCEYHHLLPPLPQGQVEGLTGNNTSYDRALLERYRAVYSAGRWENHLHEAMRRDGVPLRSCPTIVVGHKMHYTVGSYAVQRYLYSRAYSAMRFAGTGAARRVMVGLATLALPPLLLLRIIRTVWGKDSAYRSDLVLGIPLLGLFTIAWAVGDAVGAWFGDGGALARVR